MYLETVEQWDAEIKRQYGLNHKIRDMQKKMERGEYYDPESEGAVELVNELIELGVMTPTGDTRRR